jgi:glycosyltransferase involved in cell wall biosynthesis
MKQNYIPKDQRKTILFMSDDPRLPSGVGIMAKEIIANTCHHFNYFSVGAAIKHPDEGKLIDVSKEFGEIAGIDDAYVRIYPSSGYGNPDLVRAILSQEKIDGILHFTDPRFWIWLYQMEHEIRQKLPLFFYHIWDCPPYPLFNRNFYESCDYIACISKQTKNIVENVWEPNHEDWQLDYIPHGCDHKIFRPITENDTDFKKMMELKKSVFGGVEPEFILLYNARNIRRKMTSDIILAYKTFCDTLPKEKSEKCALILHTAPVDENGTDLPAVVKAVCPDYKVYFSSQKIDAKDLNMIYNISDCVINIASNEGWGLCTTEAMLAGVPFIGNVTGGIQDQMRFEDENGDWINFNKEWPSNHDGRFKKCGDWTLPVFPATRSLVGSPLTPYIFDDRAKWEDVAVRIREFYDMTKEERRARGLKGREWAMSNEAGFTAEIMGERFIQGMNKAFDKWTPRKRFDIYKI